MFMRIALLLTLSWIVGLTAPLFAVLGEQISGRDLILIGGGVFLLWKATGEIHALMEGEDEREHRAASTFAGILLLARSSTWFSRSTRHHRAAGR